MRFKIDENLPLEIVDLLGAQGQDVATVLGRSSVVRRTPCSLSIAEQKSGPW